MKSIFISSTFRDMQAERDVLHQQVFPVLRKRLAAYGEDVQELDLRWGVDTSRMSEEKSGEFVVEYCIDSIERCKPYMVVLMGSRYGWIPEQKTIEATADDRIRRWYEEGSSITQLEIQYGALRADVEQDRCVFCFRNEDFPEQVPEALRPIYAAESPRHEEKLQALKKQIRSRSDARILEYNACWDEQRQSPGGLNDFAEDLTEALWKILSAELRQETKAEDPQEQIFRQARLTARQYLGSYVSRKMDRESGPYSLIGRSAFWFSGEPGSGKSAMMAKIADNGCRVGSRVFLYYGGNAGCRSANTLAKTLIWWFNQQDTEQEPAHIDDYLEKNIQTLDVLLRREREYDFSILIDGVDQMENETRSLLCWMSRQLIQDKPEHWRGLAVSSTADYAQKWEKELSGDFAMKKLEPLTDVELDAIAQSHSAYRGKKLDENVMRQVRRKERSHNPYYLSLLLQKLFMMSQAEFEKAEALAPGMEGLSLFMRQEVQDAPDTTEEMSIALLRETSEKLGSRMQEYGEACPNMAEPMEVLALLAASRDGLTIPQLSQALELQGRTFPTMFLERLFAYLYDSFSESDKGVWDFKHRLLRESLIRHMGQSYYRFNCKVLLAMFASQRAKADLLIYYAWQAGDVETGLKVLQSRASRITLHLPILMEMLETQEGTAYLTQLLQRVESESCCYVLLEMVQRYDMLLRNEAGSAAVLAAVQPGEQSTQAHHFYYHLLRQRLQYWNYDTRAFLESWKAMMASIPQTGDPGEMSKPLLFGLCQDILGDQRYQELWPEVLQYLESFQPETYMKRRADATLEWARRLVEYKAGADAGDRLREAKGLQAARDFIKELDQQPLGIGVVVDSWRVQIAELALEKECFKDVFELVKDRIPYLEHQFSLRGGAMVAMRLIRAVQCLAGCIKAESAINQYEKAKTLCQRAMNEYPGSYLAYLNCRTGVRLWKSFEIAKKDNEAHHALEELIPQLDKFVESVGAENIPVEVLQEYLDQRYRRVNRRRTEAYLADKDSSTVSMDVMLQMLQGDYQNVPKYETRILPWKFCAEQEADFAYMDEYYPPLEKRCRTYSVYIDMAYAQMEMVRFYDACHQEDNMITAINKMVRMINFMNDTGRNNMIWMSLGFRLEVTELLFLRYYGKSAAEHAVKAFEIMKNLDGKWIHDTKRVEEFDRRAVRCYLVMARAKMREEDQLKDAFAFTYQAINKLNGEGDTPAMDRSCDDLRSETWLLMGQILKKMGRDNAEILSRMDKYWPETQIESALKYGGHNRLVRLLRYAQGLSIRGRGTNDEALLKRATELMCRIGQEQVESGDASRWELLYDELMNLCRYYWNHSEQMSTPDCLIACMAKAFYAKSLRSELKREEQILFASYGLQWQDPKVVAGAILPAEAFQKAVLESALTLERQRGRGNLRSRVAICQVLFGKYEQALDTLSKMSDLNVIEELRLQALVNMVVALLWGENPPKEPQLPQAKEWLQTNMAVREPVIGRYLELMCAVLDSRLDGAAGIEAAFHGLTLLKPLLELPEKQLQQTVLPDWGGAMCEKLVRVWQETPGCMDIDRYKQALEIGSDALRQIYRRETEDAKKDAALDRCMCIPVALAQVYYAQEDYPRAIHVGMAALRQNEQMRKTPTLESQKKALQIYRMIRAWQDTHGIRADDALDLITKGIDTLDALFLLDNDPTWIEQWLEETANFRRILPTTQYKDENWLREKIAGSYSMDRWGCMRILNLQQQAQWQERYLQSAKADLDTIGEGQQKTLESILSDLWEIIPQTEQIQNDLLDMVDRVTSILRSMPDDMHYIMIRAVQSDVPMGQAAAFVEDYRKKMPASGL